MLAVYTLSVSFAPGASVLPGSRVVSRNAALSMEVKPVVIGVAAVRHQTRSPCTTCAPR